MDNLLLSGRYYLPADTLIRRRIESSLARTFETRGYKEIVPPMLVGLGMAQLGPDGPHGSGGPDQHRESARASFVVLSRDGNLLTLRSDLTAPVAALAARHLLSPDEPTRLYYSGSVFRAQKPGSGKPEERRQVGAELIGQTATGRQTDSEILAMAAEGLINIGLRDFCIGLNDARLLAAILDAAGAQGDMRRQIQSALASRDYVQYRESVSSLEDAGAGDLARNARGIDLLKRLPDLHAGPEALNALQVAGVYEAADDLVGILGTLEDRGLGRYFSLDLAITRQFHYYTGVVFEGYAPGAGNAVIGGGRYDDLLARFGNPAPAAGFAVDVDSVASALEALEASVTPEGSVQRWNRQLGPNPDLCQAVRSRH